MGYWGSGRVGALIGRILASMIYPIIFVTCYVAVYATRQATFEMVVMTIFRFLGFVMKRFDMSLPAFVIAFVVGPGIERAIR
ncbi:MAG: tripartite tricarboxylate transporter permease [Pseudomonadota bacterium]